MKKFKEDDKEEDYLDSKIGRFIKDASVFTIYVANLPFDLVEDDIRDIFLEFGFVNYVKLIKDEESHDSKGIAFLQMPHANEARKAIKNLNNQIINGRKVIVKVADEKVQREGAIKKKGRRKPYKPYTSKADRNDK